MYNDMSKNTFDLILDFLKAKLLHMRQCWQNTSHEPNSVFFESISQISQDFRTRKVRFQPKSQGILFFKKISNKKPPSDPSPSLVRKWSQTLNVSESETAQLLDQFGNFVIKDHRRRYGPLSRPQLRFLKKATEILQEGIDRGVYPHWNRTYVIGPMLKKSIKFKSTLTEFPEVTTIEFRPFDPLDFGSYFELPWDEYRLRRITRIQPPASLVIDYSWCEAPQNYFPTVPNKTLHESIRAQEFNHLLMTICPLLGDGDIMARLNDTILASGGPNYTPNSITQDYCPIIKSQCSDFFMLLDICGILSKSKVETVMEDWLLISNAIQTLTDARFTHIGMHSRLSLAISCIEGLICTANEIIGKEDLAKKCSLILETIGLSQKNVSQSILEAYAVRSKYVHGHRSVAAKLASDHKLLQVIEGYGRRLIIMACHFSHTLRFGYSKKKFRKYKIPAILNVAHGPNKQIQSILNKCTHSNGKLRALLQ
jgi:hypothetical protein